MSSVVVPPLMSTVLPSTTRPAAARPISRFCSMCSEIRAARWPSTWSPVTAAPPYTRVNSPALGQIGQIATHGRRTDPEFVGDLGHPAGAVDPHVLQHLTLPVTTEHVSTRPRGRPG